MRCEQVRQLFDAYLDGELSPDLATELGAHRLHCAECRRALALLEVSGHIIASDQDPVSLESGFSERLIACMESPTARWSRRLRRTLYITGPLAAAAVIALAFLGAFDRGGSKVAGHKEQSAWVKPAVVEEVHPLPELFDDRQLEATERDERLLEEWLERTRENMAAKRESGESLQRYLDLTILQWLDILDQSKDVTAGEDHFPGADVAAPLTPPEAGPTDSEDVEDL